MKRRSVLLFFALCELSLSATSAASSSAVQPFSHVYNVTAVLKGRTVATTRWTDKLEAVSSGDRQLLRRSQVSVQSNQTVRTWVSVFDPVTLSPISDTFNSSNGDILLRTFDSGYATDYSSMGDTRGIVRIARAPVPAKYSDFNSGQFGLSLVGLPLAPGYRTTLTTFGPTDLGVEVIPVEVLRQESLVVGECALDTFVVRATFAAKYSPDEGENYMTFWLTQRPPYVARLVLDTPSSGLRVNFDLDPAGQVC